MRRFAAAILASLGLLLVPLAVVGVWTQRELLTTTAFTDLTVDVVEEPDVSDALTERLVEDIQQRADLPTDARPIVRSAVRAVIATEQFETIFRATVGTLHRQLERGDERLELRLDAALPPIKERVADVAPSIAEQIPATGLPAITVITKDDAPELWGVVDTVRRASLAFPIAAALVLAAAVVVSTRRPVMLIVIGVGTFAIAVGLALLIELGRGALSDVSGSQQRRDAFDAGYGVIGGSFVTQSAIFALLGLAVAAGGALLVWRTSRNRRPAQWA